MSTSRLPLPPNASGSKILRDVLDKSEITAFDMTDDVALPDLLEVHMPTKDSSTKIRVDTSEDVVYEALDAFDKMKEDEDAKALELKNQMRDEIASTVVASVSALVEAQPKKAAITVVKKKRNFSGIIIGVLLFVVAFFALDYLGVNPFLTFTIAANGSYANGHSTDAPPATPGAEAEPTVSILESLARNFPSLIEKEIASLHASFANNTVTINNHFAIDISGVTADAGEIVRITEQVSLGSVAAHEQLVEFSNGEVYIFNNLPFDDMLNVEARLRSSNQSSNGVIQANFTVDDFMGENSNVFLIITPDNAGILVRVSL